MSCRLRLASTLVTLLSVTLSLALAVSSRAAEAIVRPALDGIFAAFETHPLVGLGELHELANGLAFNITLIKDPRFAATVGNVVVEMGAGQHQDILDRYVAGEDVPYAELSKVWRNTVAANPTITGVGYQTFFAQVRDVNFSLPLDRRIRVLLSEPPIDWSTIHTKEAWQRIYDQREYHAADTIVREILARGKKALVIYSVGHFLSFPWPTTLPVPSAGTAVMGEIVERTHPDAFFVISTYGGYKVPGCSAALEAEMNWPKEVLISPVRGTPLEDALMRPECRQQTLRGVDPLPPAEELERLMKRFDEMDTGVAADALLYLAPAAELMSMPSDSTMWMDVEYYEELRRRRQIRTGRPLPPFADFLSIYAAPPRQWTP